ncbi:unnamed protein product [Amoebophrya sp. A25]|nr:unnamed protein product [Amoebophrya sp. A25]|eukprot:GSA25T00016540001.1
MGGDGGCVPQRADMVKTAGFRLINKVGGPSGFLANTFIMVGDDSVGRKEGKILRMTSCRMTNEPLTKDTPIMADRLGNLFLKEEIISRLLAKRIPEPFMHITKLKDLKDAKITFESGRNSKRSSDDKRHHMVCPLVGKEIDDGTTRAVILWKCGCVLSMTGLDSVPSTDRSCPSCGEPDALVTPPSKDAPATRVQLAADLEEGKKLYDRLPQKIRDKIEAAQKVAGKRAAREQGQGSSAAGADDDPDEGAMSPKRRRVNASQSGRSEVFRSIFKAPGEITSCPRDGFGTGGGARR